MVGSGLYYKNNFELLKFSFVKNLFKVFLYYDFRCWNIYLNYGYNKVVYYFEV